ncbi:MAG TPA: retroviral-like aspartic protease family protein [Thermoplasmata archaeon]|nr:retroviral-like aspartic protease family protein [Thermoplasmata archaeon]
MKVVARIENIIDPSRCEEVEMIVDTGAIHPVVPRPVLERLGIEPRDEKEFTLASGERVRYQTGEARVGVAGEKVPAVVIFGPAHATPVLGVIVLESMGLRVDPSKGELQKTDLLLLGADEALGTEPQGSANA